MLWGIITYVYALLLMRPVLTLGDSTLMGLISEDVRDLTRISRTHNLLGFYSYPQLVGVRVCLGVAEAGLGCGVFYT